MEENSLGPRKRKPLSQLAITNDASLVSKKKKPNSNHIQKRAGTIIRIILKNFMCHSMLEVDLSSNVNIVIGRNGSGKSAILTALIVGLGGKASLTNRGSSIKGFIKAGKTSGSVEIQLYNGGPMAYRSSVYGERITVIRTFSASGSSSYRIKSENGETVATQFREIQNITTSLNIQVDNPICILNQDTSRNFLSSNNPTHKFTLFMKATQLDTLANDYKQAVINKKDCMRIFDEKHRNYQRLQNDLKTLRRKIEFQKSLVGIRDKLHNAQIELLWAKVRDAVEEFQQSEQDLNGLQNKYDELLNGCTTRSDRVDRILQNIRTLNDQMSELRETIKVQLRPQHDIKRIVDELKTKFVDKRKDMKLIADTIQTKTRDINIVKNEIENVNENMTKVEQEKVQRLRDLTSMSEKIKGMEDHLQTCRNDLYQISSDMARKEDEKASLRREILQMDQQINNEKNTLNALKNESGNTLLLYGRDVPRVKQLIEQNRNKFSQMPRGPLGSYIKLKNKKWAVAVESFLTPGLLGSFAVDNDKDNQLLMQIFDKAWGTGRKPPIITSKFFNKKHDVSSNLVKAPSDCASLYNILEIDDPVVSNCIVDQTGMERIMLIPNDDRAIQLLSNAASVPKNCKQGITVTGDKYYPDPNYKTYGSRYHRAQYLQVDTKEHTKQLEQNVTEMNTKKENLEGQFSTISREIREQESKKGQLEKTIMKLNNARTQIRQQLEELKASAEPEVANVELLEGELVELRNIVKQKTAQMSDIEATLKEIKASIKENEEKLQQLRNANSSLEERMRHLEDEIKEEAIRQKEIASGAEFDKRKVKECEKKLKDAHTVLKLKESTATEYTEQASNLGERQETSRKVPEIVTEIEQLEKFVRKSETTTENTEELLENYQIMHEKLAKVSEILGSLKDDLKELTTAIEMRKRHYKLTEHYFLTYIKHSFQKVMEVRQFEGSIEINMEEKKLALVVIPQHGSQGLTTTSNLSGGERSFSTVAFLYSLWQCMEFPFYFLDEFDVYMDKLNRSKVVDILLHHAENKPELQFVFLTPQDVSFIKKNVAVLRLEDPERNPSS